MTFRRTQGKKLAKPCDIFIIYRNVVFLKGFMMKINILLYLAVTSFFSFTLPLPFLLL